MILIFLHSTVERVIAATFHNQEVISDLSALKLLRVGNKKSSPNNVFFVTC